MFATKLHGMVRIHKSLLAKLYAYSAVEDTSGIPRRATSQGIGIMGRQKYVRLLQHNSYWKNYISYPGTGIYQSPRLIDFAAGDANDAFFGQLIVLGKP